MAVARVNMACGIFSAQRDFAQCPLPANLHFYPFKPIKPIMNFTYGISAVADGLCMTAVMPLRMEARNDVNIAASVLRVR